MVTSWYILRSKPQKEEFLHGQLIARGVDAFLPSLRVKPVDPRNRSARPYFPGYLFVKVNLQVEGFSVFQWMPGSLGLVSFGGEPASVPLELIQSVQWHVERANANFGKQPVFTAGDLVVVQGGVFDGYQAIFDAHLPGNDRVRVLLQYLEKQQARLVLPIRQVEPMHEL